MLLRSPFTTFVKLLSPLQCYISAFTFKYQATTQSDKAGMKKGELWRVTTLKWHSKHGVCLVSRCRLGWSRASGALIDEFTCESLQDTNSWTICTREPSRDSRSVLTCHHTRVFTPQNTIRRCTLKRTTLPNQVSTLTSECAATLLH